MKSEHVKTLLPFYLSKRKSWVFLWRNMTTFRLSQPEKYSSSTKTLLLPFPGHVSVVRFTPAAPPSALRPWFPSYIIILNSPSPLALPIFYTYPCKPPQISPSKERLWGPPLHLLPHHPTAFPFCIVSTWPLLSKQREKVGREGNT